MLKIHGRRADGFHEIETLMAPIELADTMTIEVGEGVRAGAVELTCNDELLPVDGSNLVVRAARSYMARSGWAVGLRIQLVKRIPHGAGLGGGSSDAAATLMALDEMSGCRLGHDVLIELAAALGSDIPFFLRGGAALCTGRGERVEEPAQPVPGWPLLLIKPPFGVPTPWAYQAFARGLGRAEEEPIHSMLDGIELCNHLEPPVFHKFLMLADLRQWLAEQCGVRAAMMSGSGSTIYAVLEEGAGVKAIEESARGRYGQSLWMCATRIMSSGV